MVTSTGAVYGFQPRSFSWYSTDATPEPSSAAVTVTVAEPTKLPSASCAPVTSAVTVGGVVSSPSPATTVKVDVPSAEVLPAASVAR